MRLVRLPAHYEILWCFVACFADTGVVLRMLMGQLEVCQAFAIVMQSAYGHGVGPCRPL